MNKSLSIIFLAAGALSVCPAADVTPARGVSSSEGIKAMEEIVDDTLRQNYSYAWTGMAYQETQSGTTVSVVFIFAIIMTLLVLAAQYESWSDPIAVVFGMIINAIIGTTCVPAFWVVMQRLQEKVRGNRSTTANTNGVPSAASDNANEV